MIIDELFVADIDNGTHRVCGTCGKTKPVEEFYKDGKDSHGKTKYRRDCIVCYRSTRMLETVAKVKKGTKK